MKRMLAALALTLSVAAPAFAEDAGTIAKQMGDQWMEAYNKGDAAALAALYTSDAVLMPQGVAQPIVGRAEIQKFFTGWLQQKLENGAIPASQATLLNDKTLITAGTWSGEIPATASAPKATVGGTYLTIAVQEGAQWHVRAETWNMMPPPAAQPATAATSESSASGSSTPNK